MYKIYKRDFGDYIVSKRVYIKDENRTSPNRLYNEFVVQAFSALETAKTWFKRRKQVDTELVDLAFEQLSHVERGSVYVYDKYDVYVTLND